jgi:glutathione-regulated potassium-efflux system ancillary protein KefG
VRPAPSTASIRQSGEDQASGCLLVVAHPRLDRSGVNSALLEGLTGDGGVEIHDLYEAYPDYQIDVAAEQARLSRFRVIGLQFPLFWYAMPSLLKEWFDLVWLHGFAYGHGASALVGKHLFCAVSTGGDAGSYRAGGQNGHTIEEFLRPIERTAALCRMQWAAPHVLHDAPRMRGDRLSVAALAYGEYLRERLSGASE